MMRALWLALVSVVMLAGLTDQASALSCSVSTAGTLIFDPAYARSTPVTGGGSIGVTCSEGVSNETVNICLALGSAAAGSNTGTGWPLIMGSNSPRFTVKSGSIDLAPTMVKIGTVALTNGGGSSSFLLAGGMSWLGYSGVAGTYSTSFPYAKISFGLSTDCTTHTFESAAPLTVTGEVLSTCSVTASPMGFGPIDANINSPITSTANINVDCTVGGSYTVSLSQGDAKLGAIRAMVNGAGNQLRYELYKDAARSTVWGAGGDALTSTASATQPSATNYTVYGVIPVPSGDFPNPVPVGNYNDTVVVTITY